MEADKKQENPKVTKVNIGELLIEARENQNLSATDIASQLNLTVSIITKIEDNQFEQDIPLAFIRGYVRSYAQKVGLDVNTICAEFDRQSQTDEEPVQNIQRISHFSKKRKEINTNNTLFKVVSYLIVISLLSFAGWEAWKRFGPKTSQNETELNSIPLNTDSASSAENNISLDLANSQAGDTQQENQLSNSSEVDAGLIESESGEQNRTESSSQLDSGNKEVANAEVANTGVVNTESSGENISSAVTEPQVQREELDRAQSQSEVGSSRDGGEQYVALKTGPVIDTEFVFTGDCWVQVKDANGEVIAVGVKKSGKIMPLTGVAPFDVILGEPSVVKITLNGEAFDLSGYRPGRIAKFVLQ